MAFYGNGIDSWNTGVVESRWKEWEREKWTNRFICQSRFDVEVFERTFKFIHVWKSRREKETTTTTKNVGLPKVYHSDHSIWESWCGFGCIGFRNIYVQLYIEIIVFPWPYRTFTLHMHTHTHTHTLWDMFFYLVNLLNAISICNVMHWISWWGFFGIRYICAGISASECNACRLYAAI